MQAIKLGRVALFCGALALIAPTLPIRAETPEQSLQRFERAFNDLDSWTDEAAAQQLNIAIILRNRDKATTALDGRPQLRARDGKLPVTMAPLYYKSKWVAYEGPRNASEYRKRAMAAAEKAGVQCSWQQRPSPQRPKTDELYICSYNPWDLMERLLAYDIQQCPPEHQDCFDYEGRNWAASMRDPDSADPLRGRRVEMGLVSMLHTALIPVVQVVDRNGKELKSYETNIVISERPGDNHIVIAPQEYGQEVARSVNGEVVATFPYENLIAMSVITSTELVLQQEAEQARREKEQHAREQSITMLQANSGAFGALKARPDTDAYKVCAIGVPSTAGQIIASDATKGVTASDAYKTWSGISSAGVNKAYATLEEIYTGMQTKNCDIVLANGEDLTQIAAAMNRDGIAFDVMPTMLEEAEALELYARAEGYAGLADMQLAREFGGINASELRQYRDLGITTIDDYKATVARMEALRYPVRAGSVAEFLKDETAARPHGITALAYRNERLAEINRKQEAQRLKQLEAEPYLLTITCRHSFSGTTLYLEVCANGPGELGRIKLRNGGKYREYEFYEFYEVGSYQNGGFVIKGKPDVAIEIPNTGDDVVLELEVKDLRSGQVIAHRSARQYQWLQFIQ